jgi:hypothetical protein
MSYARLLGTLAFLGIMAILGSMLVRFACDVAGSIPR